MFVENLTYLDVQVLGLEILETTKGEILNNIIQNLANTVGQPLQIISDHGSDIKKGIELYIKTNPTTIYTYDYRHQVALWLKGYLQKNPSLEEFLVLSRSTRPKIHQTELYFLIPPKAGQKARYHNIDLFVNWGLNVIEYWHKQDFSLFSTGFILDTQTLNSLKNTVPFYSYYKLLLNRGFSTNDLTSFSQYLTENLCITDPNHLNLIINGANVGRRQFLKQLGWLLTYENELYKIANVLEVFALGKSHLNLWGLNPDTLEEWSDFESDFDENFPEMLTAFHQVKNYFSIETQQLKSETRFPASSDIIESLFAKYKLFIRDTPLSEVNEMVLSLVLFTTEFTTDTIRQALESITNNDVIDWIQSTFGQSLLSKRKQAFSTA